MGKRGIARLFTSPPGPREPYTNLPRDPVARELVRDILRAHPDWPIVRVKAELKAQLRELFGEAADDSDGRTVG
jgi:hypothetical protein